MNKKALIFIVGKTSSGKDTLADYISDTYGIPLVVSYTTRLKRDYETDGKEHFFVDPYQMSVMRADTDIIAYTKNDKTGIEYCANSESFKGGIAIYIINPDGIRWFNEHGDMDFYDTFTIYVDCTEEEIRHRAYIRGDNASQVVTRLDSERDEFNAFKEEMNRKHPDNYLYINNTRLTKEMLYRIADTDKKLNDFIRREMDYEKDYKQDLQCLMEGDER